MIVRLLREPLPVKLAVRVSRGLPRAGQAAAARARPELVDQALRLGPPSADALRAIIRGPFERFPGRRLRARARRRAGAAAARGARPSASAPARSSLSEVQTVCLRLWQSADPDARCSPRRACRGCSRTSSARRSTAFAPDACAPPPIALLSQMVTAAGTRNVISAEDLRARVRERGSPTSRRRCSTRRSTRLERDSKLVRRERRRDLYLYEITSEFLVPWISRRREELRAYARERRRGRRRLRVIGSASPSRC